MIEHTNIKLQRIIFPNECSIILRTGSFRTPLHYHEDALELTWIKRGSGERIVNNIIENFTKDDLVLIGLRTPHVWEPNNDIENPQSKVLHFSYRRLRDLLLVPELTRVRKFLDITLNSGIKIVDQSLKEFIIDQVIAIEDTFEEDGKRINLLAFQGLLNILIKLVQSPSSAYYYLGKRTFKLQSYHQVTKGKLKWGEVLESIESDCCAKGRKGQKHIMEKAGYTDQARFSRDFQKITKMTFSQYVYNCKEDKVKYHLKATNMRIKDIYIRCGINPESSYPFIKKFKTRNRCTPKEFREKFRNIN